MAKLTYVELQQYEHMVMRLATPFMKDNPKRFTVHQPRKMVKFMLKMDEQNVDHQHGVKDKRPLIAISYAYFISRDKDDFIARAWEWLNAYPEITAGWSLVDKADLCDACKRHPEGPDKIPNQEVWAIKHAQSNVLSLQAQLAYVYAINEDPADVMIYRERTITKIIDSYKGDKDGIDSRRITDY